MEITYTEGRLPARNEAISLYRANGWSSAEEPERLMAALAGSHHLVTAHDGDRLVGLGNAISDGHLVVYYPHLLVHPEHHGKGVGRRIMEIMRAKYEGLHQHMLIAEEAAVGFYRRVGFARAGTTVSMWIYDGDDHN